MLTLQPSSLQHLIEGEAGATGEGCPLYGILLGEGIADQEHAVPGETWPLWCSHEPMGAPAIADAVLAGGILRWSLRNRDMRDRQSAATKGIGCQRV